MVDMPTRSRIESWATGHLQSGAATWERQADTVEQSIEQALHAVRNMLWRGEAADRANDKMFETLVKIRPVLEQLRQAAKVARRAVDAIEAAKRDAVAAITNAEDQFFAVSESLDVTDRLPPILGAALGLIRELVAAHLRADIRAKAMLLAHTDQTFADQLNSMAALLHEFDLPGGRSGGPSGAPATNPSLTGGPSRLTQSGTSGDLNATIPGSGIEISGDGRNGYPTLNGERNPLEVPDNTRPLPTGTIVGPDGKQYAMYSEVPYNLPNGQPNPEYATANTTVVDMNDPKHAIGVLPGISQASGAYDPKTNRMVIVGNTGPHPGDRTRMLYESDAIDPANPNGWMQTLHPIGEIKGLPGDRENQIVALKGGGFMLVGSDNYNPNTPGAQPMSAVTAATPEGLLNAKATPLFPPGSGTWPGNAPPYGPTVVGTTYDPVTGKETVNLRVSTWEDPPGWDGHGTKPYNPKTYDTNVTVQH